MAHTRKASQSGIVAPTTVSPHFTGQIYYDTVAGLSYISKSKTVGDWILLGAGDMTKAVYDINLNNITDKAEGLDDGAGNTVSSLEIRTHLDNLPDIQKDDVDIVTDFKKLNFEGGITVVDDGAGKATVSIAGASGDLASVQKHRTNSFLIQLSWTDITLDTTDVENDTSILEADNTNTERILIKETGLYLLSYGGSVNSTTADHPYSFRVLINGATLVNGSLQTIQDDFDELMFGYPVLAELTAGDYITFQAKQNDTPLVNTNFNNIIFSATRLKGSKGDKGDTGIAGSGTTVNIKEDNVNVLNTPHDTINFEDGFRVTDEGSNQVSVKPPVFGTEFQFYEALVVSITTSTLFQNKLDFNTSDLPEGNYKVEWSYGWNHDQQGNDFEARLALDNDTDINDLIMWHKQEAKDSGGNPNSTRFASSGTTQAYRNSGHRILNLSGVHNFKLDYRTDSNGDESAIWDVTLTIYRVS